MVEFLEAAKKALTWPMLAEASCCVEAISLLMRFNVIPEADEPRRMMERLEGTYKAQRPPFFLTKPFSRPQLLFVFEAHREIAFFSSPQPENPERELVCCSCQSTCTFPKCLWILCSYQWLLLLSS
ncbi:unnamed protein product [Brassica oleracea var. botrytis]